MLLIDPHGIRCAHHQLLIVESEGQKLLVRICKGLLELQSFQIPFLYDGLIAGQKLIPSELKALDGLFVAGQGGLSSAELPFTRNLAGLNDMAFP